MDSSPVIDVFIVTYIKDAEWLKWSLKVLLKNLSGYRDIHIVVQDSRVEEVKAIVQEPATVKWHFGEPWPGKGYYQQQFIKMQADTYSDADYFFMVDSDLFIAGPCSVMDFFENGKPAWMWAYYTDFTQDVPWQAPTMRATQLECPQEFMQALPMAIHRTTFEITRWFIEQPHGMTLSEYIMGEATAGRKFSEFNCLGRIAWEQQQHLYSFIDRNRNAAGEPSQSHWPKGYYGGSRQYWSKSSIKEHMPEIMSFLGESIEGLRIECTKYGHWVVAYDTHFKPWVMQAGRLDHDRAFLARILPFIKPGDTVVDAGGNIGTHSEAYAKATAGVDGGRVLAFEPNLPAFECLRRNMFGHGHVQCINKGLSNQAGRASMVQSDNVGASYLVAGEEVELTTLDSYELLNCALIKIDVEGWEFSVLQGAWRTISLCSPVLVIEINRGALARNGVLPDDIYSWLRLRGYTIEGAEDSDQFDVICKFEP